VRVQPTLPLSTSASHSIRWRCVCPSLPSLLRFAQTLDQALLCAGLLCEICPVVKWGNAEDVCMSAPVLGTSNELKNIQQLLLCLHHGCIHGKCTVRVYVIIMLCTLCDAQTYPHVSGCNWCSTMNFTVFPRVVVPRVKQIPLPVGRLWCAMLICLLSGRATPWDQVQPLDIATIMLHCCLCCVLRVAGPIPCWPCGRTSADIPGHQQQYHDVSPPASALNLCFRVH
jgi:hypothetical protein